MKEKKIRNNSKLFDFYRDINRTSVPLFFDNLTHLEKTIIEYRVYDNLSFAEISQKIMMPKSSVYRYYNKAINKLKKDDSSN